MRTRRNLNPAPQGADRRELLSRQLQRQHERSIREAEISKNPDLIDTDEFWNCWLCRKLSYDLLHGTFIPGVNFSIDTALQELLLTGFYILFPEYPKILNSLTRAQKKKKEKLLACWRFLFLNSCAAIRDRKEAISLSFTRSNYQKNGPYHSEYWSYTELQAVTKKAAEAGYYRKFRGRNRKGGDSYITRLEILEGFTGLIDDYVSSLKLSDDVCVSKELTGYDFVLNTPLPKPAKPALVIKQDDDSRTVPNLNNRATEQMYNRVVNYNEFMQQQEIVISVDLDSTADTHLDILFHAVTRNELILLNPEQLFECEGRSGILQKFKDRYTQYHTTDLHSNSTDNPGTTYCTNSESSHKTHTQHTAYGSHQLYPAKNSDLIYDYSELVVPSRADLLFLQTRFQCYRSFNDDMKHGGRLYGLTIQRLPSEIRVRTLINGSLVVELDYKSLHPSLLYSSIGTQPPKDIYIVDGSVDGSVDGRLRSLYKTIALVGFNADNERAALGAIREECRESFGFRLRDDEIMAGLHDFFSHNPELRQFYLKGVGGTLQFQDSQIMDIVLTRLRKEDLPAIPVHDSAIVPIESAIKAKEAMVSAYQRVTGTHHIPLITEEVKSPWKKET